MKSRRAPAWVLWPVLALFTLAGYVIGTIASDLYSIYLTHAQSLWRRKQSQPSTRYVNGKINHTGFDTTESPEEREDSDAR